MPKEVVTDFREYALSVFDAYAEEHLLGTDRPTQDFIQFLRDDLVSHIWSEFEGEGGVWRRIVEDSLTLSSFEFPGVPGRNIGRADYLLPRGRDVIEAAMRDRIDSHWVSKSWDYLEQRAAQQTQAEKTADFPNARDVIAPSPDRAVPLEPVELRRIPDAGRRANAELNYKIARIVGGFGDTWREHLPELCEALDREQTSLPSAKKWQRLGCEDWADVLGEDREGLVKALQYRLDWLSKHPETN